MILWTRGSLSLTFCKHVPSIILISFSSFLMTPERLRKNGIKKQIYLFDISAQIHVCIYTYVSIPYVGIIQIRFAGLGIHPTLSLLDTQAPCCSLFCCSLLFSSLLYIIFRFWQVFYNVKRILICSQFIFWHKKLPCRSFFIPHGSSFVVVMKTFLMAFYVLIRFRACSRAYLKNHSHNLHTPLCGVFCPNSVVVLEFWFN